MIETKIEGTPSAVDSAADFLKSTLKSAFDTAADLMPDARREAESSWEGAASDAYRGMLSKILKATDTESGLAAQAGQVVQEYAGQLAAIQQRMASRRSEAEAGGLTVNGTVIEAPAAAVSPGDLPAGASREAADEWYKADASFQAQKNKVALYNSLVTEVAEDRQSFTNWIETNLKSQPAKLESASQAKQLDDAVKDSPGVAEELTKEYAKELPIETLKNYFEQTEKAKSAAAAGLKSLAADAKKGLRSGNPAVRAAAKDTDIASTLRDASALEDGAETAGKIAKGIPGLDVVAGTVSAGLDIASGDSPGKAILTNGAAVGVGILGGAAVVALAPAAPVIAIAAGGALAAYGGEKVAEYAWDHWIPKSFENKVDSDLSSAGSHVASIAKTSVSDIGSVAHDVAGWL